MPRSATSAVAAALFTPVQQRVLGLLFGQPERRFQSAEVIRLAGSGTGAVHRQLLRLEKAGLVTVSREGNQKYYAARKDAPVFPELHGLVVKTVGIVDPLRAALAPVAKEIDLAFVFGSVVKGNERAESDIDLLVVTDVTTDQCSVGQIQARQVLTLLPNGGNVLYIQGPADTSTARVTLPARPYPAESVRAA